MPGKWSGWPIIEVIQGMARIPSLWTKGKSLIPCDFRMDDKPQGGKTQNEPFHDMLQVVRGRGFRPRYVRMDSWYSSFGAATSNPAGRGGLSGR